jgi:hypothetical protein
LENSIIRLSICRGGGHVGEIRFLQGNAAQTVNPLRVPHYQTMEPYDFDDVQHAAFYQPGALGRFLAGYMGHLLCVPEFGGPSEASITEWVAGECAVTAEQMSFECQTTLPESLFLVGRTLSLSANSSVVRVEEWVENLAPFGRPFHWVQHVTFGPPFAEPGKQFMDMSNAWWAGSRGSREVIEKRDGWPYSMNGTQRIDGRPFHAGPGTSSYNAFLFENKNLHSYFTMYHCGFPLLIGYIFPNADNPWILDWQENCSNQQKPWDSRVVARGIEFGTTPFDEGLQSSVLRGRLLDTPIVRWIDARARLTTSYLIFIAEIELAFAGVTDIRLTDDSILVKPSDRSRPDLVVKL